MKKTILILVLATMSVACKKKDITPTEPVQKCECRSDSTVNVSQTPGIVVWQGYYGSEVLPQYNCEDDQKVWYNSSGKTKYTVNCQ